MNARVQEGDGRACVQMVRGDDANGADAVGAGGLGHSHVPIAVIAARQSQFRRRGAGAGRVRGQRPRDQRELPVQPRGDAVNATDEGPRAAADHAKGDRGHSPSALSIAA